MSATRFAALSNDPVAEQAAGECLLGGGSALSAVLAGYFASAGANAGVLLGPLSILLAGVGSGVRAFDGRLRQPGLGAKRPRGFREEEPVPDAAFVAVPNSVAAAAVALAYGDERSMSAVVRYGVQAAQRAGADTRAELMQVVRGMGAAAFSDPAFVRPLLHVAGASEGGLLTPTDFAIAPVDIDFPATAESLGDSWFEAPWSNDGAAQGEGAAAPVAGAQMILIAFDTRGVAAAVGYQRCRDGVSIDAMELEAPRTAVPVLRGITRVAPGERLATPVSMAICVESGRPIAVVGSPTVSRLRQHELTAPQLELRRDPSTRSIVMTRR